MASDDEQVPEPPATWANVAIGRAKEVVGHVLHSKKLVEEGEEQVEAAHEVREEYLDEHADPEA